MSDNLAPVAADPVTAALPEDTSGTGRGLDTKPPEAAPEPPKPKSISESVKEAIAKVEAEPEKPEAKPEVKPEPVKAEKPQNVAAEKPDMATGQEGGEKPPSEGKQVNAPARLLPQARDKWYAVPREVKDEWTRFEREVETERETYREAAQFHEETREYREMAKSVGTTVPAALKRYVEFDRQISADFGRGMAMIAADQGKTAAEAVASLIRGLGSTPEQYAKHVMANPQAHLQAPMPQSQQQRPPNDPVLQRVEQLEQQLNEAQMDRQRDQVVSDIIAPFEAEHPRFAELQDDIVKLLKTDIVPLSLSPDKRLEVAYDMAERLRPPLRQAPDAFADLDENADAARVAAGKKSISGAPGNPIQSGRSLKTPSIREAIVAASRQHGAA
ncbi:MAG: hypothetical protein ACRCXM_17240 [Beijerinckiaceae bacterium]